MGKLYSTSTSHIRQQSSDNMSCFFWTSGHVCNSKRGSPFHWMIDEWIWLQEFAFDDVNASITLIEQHSEDMSTSLALTYF